MNFENNTVRNGSPRLYLDKPKTASCKKLEKHLKFKN